MFKAIKEFFTGKPAPVETPAPVAEYKVEAPATVVEGAGQVEVPAQSADSMCCGIEGCTHDTAPAKKAKPAKKPAVKKAPAPKKPRKPKAPK